MKKAGKFSPVFFVVNTTNHIFKWEQNKLVYYEFSFGKNKPICFAFARKYGLLLITKKSGLNATFKFLNWNNVTYFIMKIELT